MNKKSRQENMDVVDRCRELAVMRRWQLVEVLHVRDRVTKTLVKTLVKPTHNWNCNSTHSYTAQIWSKTFDVRRST